MSDGKFDEAKGRTKEAAGDLTGSDRLRREGKVDKAGGKMKQAVDNVTRKVRNLVGRDR